MTSLEMVVAYLAAGIAHTLMRFLVDARFQRETRREANKIADEFGVRYPSRYTALYIQIVVQIAFWPFGLIGLLLRWKDKA